LIVVAESLPPSVAEDFQIGDRVLVGSSKPGIVVYIGEVHFGHGDWAGVVLDKPDGKNDGTVRGHRYFMCEPMRGVFSRLNKLTKLPSGGTVAMDGVSAGRQEKNDLAYGSGKSECVETSLPKDTAGSKPEPVCGVISHLTKSPSSGIASMDEPATQSWKNYSLPNPSDSIKIMESSLPKEAASLKPSVVLIEKPPSPCQSTGSQHSDHGIPSAEAISANHSDGDDHMIAGFVFPLTLVLYVEYYC